MSARAAGRTRAAVRRPAWVRCAAIGAAAVTLHSGGGPAAAFAQAPASGSAHVLIVTGASGEAGYATRFEQAGAALVDAFRTRAGLPAASVTWLAEAPERDRARIAGRSAKADVERALDRIAAQAKAGDQVLLVLIGHGSHEGAQSRVNLPGPDITAAEVGRKLDAIRGARVAVVNAASASGDWVAALAKPGRVVATATKTAFERNETRFPQYFARAYAGDSADADKDARVSLLEAFDFARREVARDYQQRRNLLTEHALLDGDGNGTGDAAPTAQGADGRLAHAFVLGGRASAPLNSSNPMVARLAAEQAALEREVAAHRARKSALPAAEYERELERLLVALAEKTRALRAAEGRTP